MYSQRDPRWSSIRLGTSTRTIGQDGCLLCCVAAMLQGAGNLLDPARLNRWLCLNGGYTNGNRFVFASVEPLGAQLHALYDWRKSPADIGKLVVLYQTGYCLILEVNFHPWGKFTSHWVGLVDAGDDFEIQDPWLPPSDIYSTISLLATYARPTQGLEQAIYRAVAYDVEENPF